MRAHSAMILLAGASDPTGVFLQYGAVGAAVVVLGAFAWSTIKRERDRADRMERELQEMNNRVIDRFADVLKEAKDALVAANDYLRDLARKR